MTISLKADICGHVIDVDVNGAHLLLSRADAFKLAHYLSHMVDALYYDDRAKRVANQVSVHYFGDDNATL